MNQFWLVTISLMLVLWGLCSFAWLVKLGVFSGKPLLAAPARPGGFSLLVVAGVVLLYVGLSIFALVLWLNHTDLAPILGFNPDKDMLLNMRGFLGHNIAVLLASTLAIIYVRLPAIGGLQTFGLAKHQILPGIIAGIKTFILIVPFLIGINALTVYISKLLTRPEIQPHRVLQTMRDHPNPTLVTILCISAIIIAPFGEELLFRGLFQTSLLQRRFVLGSPGAPEPSNFIPNRRWLAILIASIVFTAVHLDKSNYEHFPVLFVLAIALGYVYERTGNLWSSITVHVLFNTTNIVLFTLNSKS